MADVVPLRVVEMEADPHIAEMAGLFVEVLADIRACEKALGL